MITLRKSAPEIDLVLPPARLPCVNLLPPEVAEQARLRQTKGYLSLVVVAALVVVGLLFHQAQGSVGGAQSQLDTASAAEVGVIAQTAKLKDVTAQYARAAAAEQGLVQAMSAEVRYSRLLNDLSLSIPDNVWLTNAAWTQPDAGSVTAAASSAVTSAIGTATFSGVAFEYGDVSTWLEALADQKGYSNPYLSTSAAELLGTRKTVKWTATVDLGPDTLSGRYVKAGK